MDAVGSYYRTFISFISNIKSKFINLAPFTLEKVIRFNCSTWRKLIYSQFTFQILIIQLLTQTYLTLEITLS